MTPEQSPTLMPEPDGTVERVQDEESTERIQQEMAATGLAGTVEPPPERTALDKLQSSFEDGRRIWHLPNTERGSSTNAVTEPFAVHLSEKLDKTTD